MKLFHATLEANIDHIMKKGLLTNDKTPHKSFSNCKNGYIYFSKCPFIAESFAEAIELDESIYPENINLDDVVILYIDSDNINMSLLVPDTNILNLELFAAEEMCYQYPKDIPPQFIKRL